MSKSVYGIVTKRKERNLWNIIIMDMMNMESIELLPSQNIIENRIVKKNPEMKYDKASNTTMALASALGTDGYGVQCAMTMAMCIVCGTQKLQKIKQVKGIIHSSFVNL